MSMFTDIVGFARSVHDRKQAHQVDDALKNYMTDPEGTIQAVNQIDPRFAINLQNQSLEQSNARRKAALDATTEATGYLRALPQGSDYGATIEKMSPFLQNTLGMKPDEIVRWRDAIVSNPSMITALDDDANKARATAAYAITNTAPGAIASRDGKVLFRAPYKPEVKTIRRADGGTDLVPFDPNTAAGATGEFSQAGPTPNPGPMPDVSGGGITISEGGSGGGRVPVSIRNNNPGALRDDGRSKWRGMTGSKDGFLQFDTPANGRRAHVINIMNQQRLHGITTLNDLFDKYAPDSDGNNSDAYAATVARELGVDPSAQINLADPTIAGRIADASARVESGGARGTVTGGGTSRAAPTGAIYSSPGKARVRAATPEELAGYPANTMAQVDETGKLVNIRTPSAASNNAAIKQSEKHAKVATMVEGTTAGLDTLRQAVVDLRNTPDLDSYVGNVSGRLPAWLSGGRNDFNEQLETLKTQVGMNALQNMRALSPTGGALGNVSNYENKMLQRSLAALGASQSPAQFRKNLQVVIATTDRAKKRLADALARTPGGEAAPAPAQSGPAQGQVIRNKQTGEERTWNGRGWTVTKKGSK